MSDQWVWIVSAEVAGEPTVLVATRHWPTAATYAAEVNGEVRQVPVLGVHPSLPEDGSLPEWAAEHVGVRPVKAEP